MFTGLIVDVGELAELKRTSDGARLRVRTELARQLHEGDSVAVSGVCLTVTAANGSSFSAEAVNETLARTSLSEAYVGAPLNLELAMRTDDRLGGHLVQGHVDGIGAISAVVPDGFAKRLTITPADAGLLRYMALKGSITVDGVSLTIAGLDQRSFTVALIPETLERTNLRHVQVGTPVNLEVDVLAKYVERLIPGGTSQ